MKNRLLLFLSIVVLGSRVAGKELRYFDAPEKHSGPTLTVLYPSTGTIKALTALRETGQLPGNVLVVGVYHEKEETDYTLSHAHVTEKGIDWFRFHCVYEKLESDKLFGRNECTDEFVKIFDNSDGIVFFGGYDVPPYLYGEKSSLLSEIETPVRSFLELSFIFHLLGGLQDERFQGLLERDPEFPVLGICLGCQSLNIGTGGTLVQDIPSEIYGVSTFEDLIRLKREQWHYNPNFRLHAEKGMLRYNLHHIRLDKEGFFVKRAGFMEQDFPLIISSHHQMVEKLGKGMRIIAVSVDGLVPEAIEHERFANVLGVQFHPEFPLLWDKDKTHRIEENDTPLSLPSMLEQNPPSTEFHRSIWKWLAAAISR